MIRLLLDENISPALVRLLADLGVYSQSVPHVGLAGRPDHAIWEYALDHGIQQERTKEPKEDEAGRVLAERHLRRGTASLSAFLIASQNSPKLHKDFK